MNKHKTLIHIAVLAATIIGSILYFYIFNDYQEIFKNSWLSLIFMVIVIHVLIELFFKLLLRVFQEKIPHIFKKENALPATPMQWQFYNFAMIFFTGLHILFFVVLVVAILILGGLWLWVYYFGS
ncbi:hypothetical protein [Moraxella sp. VT-16-12]|uniref:hypothetical protein n=1 Tax=Moraxella sp. VT-16-12 TaxID=2014877 RepID=UPI000B7CA0F9|nr:hypothetical protein [Moraxella sp. VT-16-12]TWV80827.1 hypothetical protein CEW93_009510 [Moraxella sp. VT-16-12]